MSLIGNLDIFDLASILQLLHADKKTGLLKLENEMKKVSVFIKEGNIAYATDPQADTRLGYLLRSGNVITDEQLKRCLQRCHEETQDLGKMLVDHGLITPEILHKYAQKQTENIVFDLFCWEKGNFEYRDVRLNPEHMLLFQLNTMKMLLEGSRRVDEMCVLKKRIPGDDLIFEKSEEIKGATNALTEQERVVFSLVNGTYSVRQVIDESGYDEYLVYKILNAFIVTGTIACCEDIRLRMGAEDTCGAPNDLDMDMSLNEPDCMRLKRSNPGDSVPTNKVVNGGRPSYNERFYNSLVGKQLGNYGAIAFIGSGHVGGVFQGWDVVLERKVALKVMAYELASQAGFRDMFVNTALKISNLDHPSIAQIHDVGHNDDIIYYAMEFVDGDTLADLIRRHRTLNILKGLGYLINVCMSIDFMRKNDIIHRSISPRNIMVDSKGAVKIVDFGLAMITDSNLPEKLPELITGAPWYMSPEALAGRPADHRSDIYSLGAVFYHAFTGHPPFEGDNIQDALDLLLNRPLTPLNEKNPKLPNVLGKIIEKMMAKNPQNRFQDYESLTTTLKNLHLRARINV